MNIDVNCQLHRQLNELKCSKQMDLVSPCDMMCSYLSVNYLARTVSTIDCGGMSKCAKVNVPKLVPKILKYNIIQNEFMHYINVLGMFAEAQYIAGLRQALIVLREISFGHRNIVKKVKS
ncbi:hypothetical protein BLOT_005928 [Blomia tropicalis]|nr:hypothetical protein BLOT_005928 [Blomia tropicalis]